MPTSNTRVRHQVAAVVGLNLRLSALAILPCGPDICTVSDKKTQCAQFVHHGAKSPKT